MGNKLLVISITEVNQKLQSKVRTLVFLDEEEGRDFIENSGKTIISVELAEVMCSYKAF
ncbi:hypothetical protein MEDNBIBF_00031 [Escherichia phage SR02]|uniref:Uncharacterized protein n=1 Tax=Escherichia phage SR02 TaxID=3056226 RepID=A0AA50F0K4_9CAUD|nr:hypothetical protein MEDNBIBF_00031 [Escherichia phage SR02]